MFAEFLHMELSQAEAFGGEQVASHFSFNGFDRFVKIRPSIFVGIVLLLFPLSSRGSCFMTQELEIASKGGHRVGELQAKVNAQTQRLQMRYMERLHLTHTEPWLQARSDAQPRLAALRKQRHGDFLSG